VGAATCQQCHGDNHADWLTTAHATALESLEAIGQDENGECLACHVVGWEQEDGFVDVATTPELEGVQCENCHGPSGDHARRAMDGDFSDPPPLNMASATCGECHTDAHHPTFDEWMQSRHANALSGLIDSGHAQNFCLECHSQDFRYANEVGVDPPTTETAQLSIECATCHEPHGGTGETAQLKMAIGNLCGECHTQGEDTLPGDEPHHPQREMLLGEGARMADGSALMQAGPHSSLFDGDACARCHVVMIEVDEPNEGSPNATGHTFNPFDDDITMFQPSEKFAGCDPCHDPDGAQVRVDNVQPDIESRLMVLSPRFDEESDVFISTNGLSDDQKAQLAVARFNFQYVEADGSLGVHNPTNADAALGIAEQIVTDLTTP